MRLVYTDRSKDDIEIAFAWYERQKTGLGLEFLNCLEAAMYSILESPELYPKPYSKFSRCLIRRFPFSVFYTIEETDIVIHSVFDNRQDPQKRP